MVPVIPQCVKNDRSSEGSTTVSFTNRTLVDGPVPLWASQSRENTWGPLVQTAKLTSSHDSPRTKLSWWDGGIVSSMFFFYNHLITPKEKCGKIKTQIKTFLLLTRKFQVFARHFLPCPFRGSVVRHWFTQAGLEKPKNSCPYWALLCCISTAPSRHCRWTASESVWTEIILCRRGCYHGWGGKGINVGL